MQATRVIDIPQTSTNINIKNLLLLYCMCVLVFGALFAITIMAIIGFKWPILLEVDYLAVNIALASETQQFYQIKA